MRIAFVAATLVAAAARGEPAAAQPVVHVHLSAPDAEAPSREVAATIVAEKRATVSTRVAASVRAVHAEEGDRVAKGQLLVTLADDDLRAQLQAARAALASAASQEKRITLLLAERAATTAELEQAQTARAQAQSAVRGVETQLAYTRIRAPFAAVVQARRISAGDLVGPGAPLYELDGGGLEVQASLSAEEARGLAQGTRLAFETETGRGEAEITALVPGGDPVSHRSGLRARVRTAPPGLLTGAFARLLLPATEAPTGLWVPLSAVVRRGDLAGVFVPENGLATLRWLSLAEQDAGRVRVRAGLASGERFVVDPAGLRDGQPVRVQP
jgi:membrane fusion protein (multidrug efflux system)